MSQLSRRSFNQDVLGSLLTFSLLETLFTRDLFADEVKPVAAQWLAKIDAMSREMKGKKLTQVQWQEQVEQLFSRIELPEMLKFLDFDKLTAGIDFKDEGERSLRAKFPEVEGLPTELIFGHQVFALKQGRSVAPHGHDNMATAFLILQGEFRGRHYDRLEDDGDYMILRPTIDRTFKAAEYSTVSDHRDNVHWFTAGSETGFIFNIHVQNIVEGKKSGRVYVDPNGEKLSDERIRAKKIGGAEAYKLFG
jgi:hypothetical protein